MRHAADRASRAPDRIALKAARIQPAPGRKATIALTESEDLAALPRRFVGVAVGQVLDAHVGAQFDGIPQ